MESPNVFPRAAPQLPIFEPPKQKTFRQAVAQTIREVKARHGLTNVELAEKIGCCDDTIGNAENENNDLSAILILRIAFHFGEEAIHEVRKLYLCAHAVEAKSTADLLREALARVEAA